MSAPHETLRAMLVFGSPDAVLWDGLDTAIIGIGLREGKPVAIYGYHALIDAFLARESKWTVDDAEEWIDFNIASAYVGPYTPLLQYEDGEDDEDDGGTFFDSVGDA